MILWVIGAGGLFGSAIVRAARTHDWTIFPGNSIPWENPEQAIGVIRNDAKRLANTIKNGHSWSIIWAAGRATNVSTQAEADAELSMFTQSVVSIRKQLEAYTNGAFLLASSAGGVYAGSKNPPFDSTSVPIPLGIYGHLKRQQEIEAQRLLSDSMNVTVVRISNLYGPGQDLRKLQGLISRIALTAITRQPLTIFVPLDTLRDYIYADDAARAALHWLMESTSNFQVRVVATGRSVSLAFIIRQMRVVARAQVPVAYGVHPSSVVQPLDLRLIPDTGYKTVPSPTTTLSAGMKNVFNDVLQHHQESAH